MICRQHFNIIKALYFRSWLGLKGDSGRIVEALIDPLVFFIIWGMLFQSSLIDPALSKNLLIVNLIWAASSALQKHATLSIMYDLWSKEITELLRAGITAGQYLSAMLLFGITAGCLIVGVYILLAPICFSVDWGTLQPLVLSLPAYALAALSISCIGAGIVLRYSQLYGFLTGVLMQFSVIIASPFVPRENLPNWWQNISAPFPLSWIFEYGRSGSLTSACIGLFTAFAWFVLSIVFYFYMFRSAQQHGRLSRI